MIKKSPTLYKEQILSVLPVNGENVQAKHIYKNAKLPNAQNPIPSAYVAKYLRELVAEGIVEKVEVSRKSVYYRRCEKVRLNILIDKFMKEMQSSLVQLPEQHLELFKGTTYRKEVTEVNVASLDDLRAYFLLMLTQKANELLETEYPELKDFYMRNSKRGLCLIHEDMFDQMQSKYRR